MARLEVTFQLAVAGVQFRVGEAAKQVLPGENTALAPKRPAVHEGKP